jgi:ParB family transcriptional regulator, chromosome partitioning protein
VSGATLLPVDSIWVSARLRPVDPHAVEMLAVSISETQHNQPILVRPKASGAATHQLVAGAHRLAAIRRLGRETIACLVREMTDAEALLVEVDENLIRSNLSPLERAESIAARFDAWRARFPDRVVEDQGVVRGKKGRPANSAKLAQFTGSAPPTMGFAEETASEVGLSRRSIFNSLALHRGLSPQLRARIAGTWIARSDSVLRQLAGLGEPQEQAAVIAVLLGGETRNVSDARAIAAGGRPQPKGRLADAPINLVRKAWKAATPSQRDAILDWLAGQPLPKGWEVRRG